MACQGPRLPWPRRTLSFDEHVDESVVEILDVLLPMRVFLLDSPNQVRLTAVLLHHGDGSVPPIITASRQGFVDETEVGVRRTVVVIREGSREQALRAGIAKW